MFIPINGASAKMKTNEVFDFIKQRIDDAAREKAVTSQQLESYRSEKAKAEEAREKAVMDADEQAYKDACRMIAGAEAGIEFNSKLLQLSERKQFANDAEDAKVQEALTGIKREICKKSFDEIERGLSAALAAANEALSKLESVYTMAEAWNTQVMKNPSQLSQTQRSTDKNAIYNSNLTIALNQVKGVCSARLNNIKLLRQLGENV